MSCRFKVASSCKMRWVLVTFQIEQPNTGIHIHGCFRIDKCSRRLFQSITPKMPFTFILMSTFLQERFRLLYMLTGGNGGDPPDKQIEPKHSGDPTYMGTAWKGSNSRATMKAASESTASQGARQCLAESTDLRFASPFYIVLTKRPFPPLMAACSLSV